MIPEDNIPKEEMDKIEQDLLSRGIIPWWMLIDALQDKCHIDPPANPNLKGKSIKLTKNKKV